MLNFAIMKTEMEKDCVTIVQILNMNVIQMSDLFLEKEVVHGNVLVVPYINLYKIMNVKIREDHQDSRVN